MIGLIWAQAANGVIGADGAVPWHLPEDLARFRATTIGASVLMGRLTWESLPERFRPLPGRVNLVLTRDRAWSAPGATSVGGIDEALEVARHAGVDDLWVIGGGEVYALALPVADRVVVTELAEAVEGDTMAPTLGEEWEATERDPVSGWLTSAAGLRYRVIHYHRALR
ncbi:MAG TPA: dihydrofolate reductase [Mycobacteriales bacterium]|nr:dihydrofolate reductase [Mycobacteriales bacterium]